MSSYIYVHALEKAIEFRKQDIIAQAKLWLERTKFLRESAEAINTAFNPNREGEWQNLLILRDNLEKQLEPFYRGLVFECSQTGDLYTLLYHAPICVWDGINLKAYRLDKERKIDPYFHRSGRDFPLEYLIPEFSVGHVKEFYYNTQAILKEGSGPPTNHTDWELSTLFKPSV